MGWTRIIAVTVLFANSTVTAVNDDFRFLVLGDSPSRVDGSGLIPVNGRIAAVAGAVNGPVIPARDDMLWFGHKIEAYDCPCERARI